MASGQFRNSQTPKREKIFRPRKVRGLRDDPEEQQVNFYSHRKKNDNHLFYELHLFRVAASKLKMSKSHESSVSMV